MMPEEWRANASMAKVILPVLVGPRTALTQQNRSGHGPDGLGFAARIAKRFRRDAVAIA